MAGLRRKRRPAIGASDGRSTGFRPVIGHGHDDRATVQAEQHRQMAGLRVPRHDLRRLAAAALPAGDRRFADADLYDRRRPEAGRRGRRGHLSLSGIPRPRARDDLPARVGPRSASIHRGRSASSGFPARWPTALWSRAARFFPGDVEHGRQAVGRLDAAVEQTARTACGW